MRFYKTYVLLFGKREKNMLFYCILFFQIFFVSCKPDGNKKEKGNQNSGIIISEKEKIWMDKFFCEFFLEGSAIYTVFGTKPLSFKEIIYATEEDWKEAAEPYLQDANVHKKKEVYVKIKKYCQDYDFPENWKKWLAFVKNYPKSPFLFAEYPTEVKKIGLAHILNVQEMIWTLEKNYDLFKKEIGSDFEPVSVVMDFTNKNSSFWNKVFSNHLLMGIVYGYGYKNAYFFSMEMNEKPEYKKDFSYISMIGKNEGEPSLSHLPLPKFRSYRLPFNDDPILEKYKLERKKIQKQLNKKNFLRKVLYQLTGVSN